MNLKANASNYAEPQEDVPVVLKADHSSEEARAAQNRQLVAAKLGEPYYQDQEQAINGWELGVPAPPGVRLAGDRALD